MKKQIKLELSLGEFEHLVTAIEGSIAELEILMSDLSWFTSESVERLQTCLLLLESQREGQ